MGPNAGNPPPTGGACYPGMTAWTDAHCSQRATRGPMPSDQDSAIKPSGLLAVVHPDMTYPWGAFCDWLDGYCGDAGETIYVAKLDSLWVIVTKREFGATDQWFGSYSVQDGFTLLGAS